MKDELINSLEKLAQNTSFGSANKDAFKSGKQTFSWTNKAGKTMEYRTWSPTTGKAVGKDFGSTQQQQQTQQQHPVVNSEFVKNMTRANDRSQQSNPLFQAQQKQQTQQTQKKGNTGQTVPQGKTQMNDKEKAEFYKNNPTAFSRDVRNPLGLNLDPKQSSAPPDAILPRTNKGGLDKLVSSNPVTQGANQVNTGVKRTVANLWEPQGYNWDSIKGNVKNIAKNFTKIPDAVANNKPIYNTDPSTREGRINNYRLVPYFNSMGLKPPLQAYDNKGNLKDWIHDPVSNTLYPINKDLQKSMVNASNEKKPYHDEVMGGFNIASNKKTTNLSDVWDYKLHSNESAATPSNILRKGATTFLNTNPTNIKYNFPTKQYKPGSINNTGVDHSALSKDNPNYFTAKKG